MLESNWPWNTVRSTTPVPYTSDELVQSIIDSGQRIVIYERDVIMDEADFTALMISLGMAVLSPSEQVVRSRTDSRQLDL